MSTPHCLIVERMVAVLQAPISTSSILPAGSFQRAFPEPQDHSVEERGGVSPAAAPEGFARDAGPMEVREVPWSTGGALVPASGPGPELPQAQIATAAQVKIHHLVSRSIFSDSTDTAATGVGGAGMKALHLVMRSSKSLHLKPGSFAGILWFKIPVRCIPEKALLAQIPFPTQRGGLACRLLHPPRRHLPWSLAHKGSLCQRVMCLVVKGLGKGQRLATTQSRRNLQTENYLLLV